MYANCIDMFLLVMVRKTSLDVYQLRRSSDGFPFGWKRRTSLRNSYTTALLCYCIVSCTSVFLPCRCHFACMLVVCLFVCLKKCQDKFVWVEIWTCFAVVDWNSYCRCHRMLFHFCALVSNCPPLHNFSFLLIDKLYPWLSSKTHTHTHTHKLLIFHQKWHGN